MPINSVSPQNINPRKNSIINPKSTGYFAVAGMGLAMVSGMVKSKSMYKSHKYFAGISVVAALTHIYLIIKRRNSKKNVTLK